ncbi:HK97-gp10 family putative phage morphogenesis protein [Pseudomonas prosekii]|nr:HK97-gp10 family putative phage morphogenesis protein [Pseudomonas prosekii]
MADNVSFKMDGLNSLLGKLKAVNYDVKQKGGRSALRKAAAVIRDKVKEGAVRVNDAATSEEIEKNVTIRWSSKRFKTTGDLGFRVGIMGGAKEYNNMHTRKGGRRGTYAVGGSSENPGGDTFYWRFVEFGTSRVAARPFMRPALAESIEQATAVFVTEYEKAVMRAINAAGSR